MPGLDAIQRFTFDLEGYLVLPGFLPPETVAGLAAAADRLERHALAERTRQPTVTSPWFRSHAYRQDPALGYHAHGDDGADGTLMIEDFWNADPAFDVLLDHQPTMDVVRTLVRERPTINNSEIRIRYQGNATGAHMGGPIGHKYRYAADASGFDCMMVRMIYFLHDVTPDNGPFCVIPGTHKSVLPWPHPWTAPEDEPGVRPLPVRAGDAIVFTEHLRHGGVANKAPRARKTIHVGYGPCWMRSQNIATADEPQYLLPETRARWTAAQRDLFSPYTEG